MNVAERLAALIGISAQQIDVLGDEYVITTGTGETSYGRDGGAATFAYRLADVEEFFSSREGRITYQDFCDAVSPVTTETIAMVLAIEHGLRLTMAGSCMPVLGDARWAALVGGAS